MGLRSKKLRLFLCHLLSMAFDSAEIHTIRCCVPAFACCAGHDEFARIAPVHFQEPMFQANTIISAIKSLWKRHAIQRSVLDAELPILEFASFMALADAQNRALDIASACRANSPMAIRNRFVVLCVHRHTLSVLVVIPLTLTYTQSVSPFKMFHSSHNTIRDSFAYVPRIFIFFLGTNRRLLRLGYCDEETILEMKGMER